MQIRLSVHFPPTQKRRVESTAPMRSLTRKRRLGKHRREKSSPGSACRATRSLSLSLSLCLVSIRSGTLRATLGAHVCRSIAHELEIYGTRARRWHGCTAEAAPGRSSLLHRRRSHIFWIVQPPVSIRAEREIEEGWPLSTGERGEARRRGNDVYQLHPAHSNCRAHVCSPPRVYLFVEPIFRAALRLSNPVDVK